MAQAGREGRSLRRGQDEALLLPHRPVRRAPADHPQGDRVRAGDGPGHDPGRPRGRARADRAQLRLRPGGANRRQPLHVPSDLQAGRPGARRFPLLHAEAVHGRLGERLPPQHLDLARETRTHSCPKRKIYEAEQDRALGDRRHHGPPVRPNRPHVLDGQLVPPPVGHRLLGAGLRRLGLSEQNDGAPRLCPWSLRVPLRSTRP